MVGHITHPNHSPSLSFTCNIKCVHGRQVSKRIRSQKSAGGHVPLVWHKVFSENEISMQREAEINLAGSKKDPAWN